MNKCYRIDYAKSATKEICVGTLLSRPECGLAWTEPSGLAQCPRNPLIDLQLVADRFHWHSGDTPKGNIALLARCGLLAWT